MEWGEDEVNCSISILLGPRAVTSSSYVLGFMSYLSEGEELELDKVKRLLH